MRVDPRLLAKSEAGRAAQHEHRRKDAAVAGYLEEATEVGRTS
jgi:hypothetical protein